METIVKTLAQTPSTGQEKVKTADPLLELAERCEQATGPDRELDAAIFLATHPKIKPDTYSRPLLLKRVWPTTNGGKKVLWWESKNGCAGGLDDAPYTSSLDAAMTLVPAGWRIGRLSELIESEMVEGVNNGPWIVQLSERHERQGRKIVSCERGPTPALALCAAALRARAADRNTHDEKGLGG